MALVPADRKQQGAVADLPVALNMLSLSLKNFMQGGFLRIDKLVGTANQRAETYDVRPRDASLNMSALSGGNQQKVVLARWLEQGPRVLLLHEPTQGVDVATRHQIYELMRARAAQGVAILWVSTDFDELATVSHRILLCAHGVIAGTIAPPFSRDRITSEVYSATARGAAREVTTAVMTTNVDAPAGQTAPSSPGGSPSAGPGSPGSSTPAWPRRRCCRSRSCW